jgi:L-iditol 2-dehydrogenase
MRALLLVAPSKLDLVDFPTPAANEDEVLVRVRACGICGSDIHGWDGSTGRRRPPLIMGHEAAGEIVGTGSRVAHWAIGDRVTFDSTIYCGQCSYCQAGRPNLCGNRRVIGVAPAEYTRHGAFAEYVAVPARVLYRLPAGLNWTQAAMIEPVSIALHAVRRVALGADSAVAVVGSGMIGLFVIQALRATGVRRIVAIDVVESRLALARDLGATDTINPDGGSPVEAVHRLTADQGVDAAFEIVGLNATLQTALEVTRRGGDVVLVGNLASRTEFPLQSVVTRELTLHGSCASAGEYPECLRLIESGAVRVEPLISAVAPLVEGPAWFARLSAKEGGQYLKVILQS